MGEEDLYSDAAAPKAEIPQEEGKESSDSNVALLPKTFVPGGIQPGSTFTVKVEEVHDDQVLVSYQGRSNRAAPPPDMEMREMMM